MIDIPVKPFYMIRHGESEANAAKVYSGQVDSPLTELGRKEAERAAHIIDSLAHKPKTVIHSNLSRAGDTAKLACRNLDAPFIELPEWAEHNLGEWQMQPHTKIQDQRLAGIDPPNGESNAIFIERIANAAATTLQRYELPIIACHGGCFRALSENYGLRVRGTKNTVLYEYIPSNTHKKFPWEVYYYDPENGKRVREALYDD